MYAFTHTQVHAFNKVFIIYIPRGRIQKYSNFSVVHSTSAIPCHIVHFKCMRWSETYSVSESLFFTGNRLPEGRYGMSYNCSFTQLYYLFVSRKGTNVFHTNTQFYPIFFPSPSSFLSIHFLSFLAI